MVGLESIALFRNLKDEEWQALRFITQERQFASGREIFLEGAPGDGVYFVKDGQVEISGLVGGNTRRVFSQLGSGEIFGEMAVIEHRPRSATATALKDTEVYFIPRGEMLSLIERSPTLAFGLLQQISHRLREFNQLHLREMVQAESLAVIGNFARSIVHDLKNPLSIIGLSAETFDMPNINAESRAKTQSRIRKQIVRINDMVSDILIFTERKRTDAELKAADYRVFVLELISDLRAEAELKSAHIEMQNAPPAVLVPFDARRLTRVFYNLVNNATDVMLNGGKIFLRFHADEMEIVTEVEDTGPGIAPEIADKLFQTFVTFGKTHGTGLGLSICKKIVEDHGGRIWVQNEPGRGATFCFALPLAK
ncbi:MAG TPA: ATP-binding protein [Verrucomicrobiae bacterium]|jgi:signal transduction histidine kinase|nr:ATP-binding protein [Verrucomicrobiae bacterium]